MWSKTKVMSKRKRTRIRSSCKTKKRSNRSISKNAIYAGVLPYAVHKGKTYYLIGKEHYQKHWSGSGLWSDFGGDPEEETPLKGAAREFYEETMGFFGTLSEIVSMLKKSKRYSVPGGYTYLVKIKYDALLPGMFERVHRYFLQCAKLHKYKSGYMAIPSCPEGLFEKTDIKWIEQKDLQKAVEKNDKKYRKEFIRSLEDILG